MRNFFGRLDLSTNCVSPLVTMSEAERQACLNILFAFTIGVGAFFAFPIALQGSDKGHSGRAAVNSSKGKKAGQPNGNLIGHGGPVKAIATNRNGTRALTGSFDYSMILWDLVTEKIYRLQLF